MTEGKGDFLDRPSVPHLDAILGKHLLCLDHGFVRLIDYMGDESAIVQAARVSYGAGTKTRSDDRGLIRYLMRHHHTTPFEMCEIKVHMKLPVFVARQWIRHRTANVNEYSARYSILANEFYIPAAENVAPQSKSNKQGREGTMDPDLIEYIRTGLERHSDGCYHLYERLIDDNVGLARELARMTLPVNVYTEWYWKVDLHNLLHLLRLRTDPHAQYEIRAYANVLADLVMAWVPTVWDAFEEYQLHAVTFSRSEMEVLRALLPENGIHRPGGHSNGEFSEFLKKLGRSE